MENRIKIFVSTKSNIVSKNSLIRKGAPVFGQGISFLRSRTDCDRICVHVYQEVTAVAQKNQECIYMYVKHIIIS